MIEIAKRLTNPVLLQRWLEKNVFSSLTPDVSNYAKGRLRAWLRTEPPLANGRPFKDGIPVEDAVWKRLKELIEWDFDYCLVTYSGDNVAVGISPHRDAGFADYEAYGLHICGESRFDYWADREAFGYSKTTGKVPMKGPPSHQLVLSPGDLVHFNCKNVHAATPSVKRWNMNFWKKKPLA